MQHRTKYARNCMPLKNVENSIIITLHCFFYAHLQPEFVQFSSITFSNDASAAAVVVNFFSNKNLHICCFCSLFIYLYLFFLHHFWVIWFYKLCLSCVVFCFRVLSFIHSLSLPCLAHHCSQHENVLQQLMRKSHLICKNDSCANSNVLNCKWLCLFVGSFPPLANVHTPSNGRNI